MREFDVVTKLIPRITTSSFGIGRHLDLTARSVFLSGIGREGIRAFHYYMRDARRCDQLYEKVGAALKGPFRHLPLITIFGERNDPFGLGRLRPRPGRRPLNLNGPVADTFLHGG